MAKLVPFTKHEAALLLDAYLNSISSDEPRIYFVKQTSENLRKMAIYNGQTIDDIYRNVNGISFQMLSMESAYQGHTVKKPATKLFLEISELYKNDNEKYLQLLEEAKAMVEGQKTVAEQYSAWLAAKVSPTQLSELFLCYRDIEEFCLKIKILKHPLFETTDLSTIKRVQKAVTETRIFQLQHKKKMKKIVSAAQYYTAFIKELNEKEIEKIMDDNVQIQSGESSTSEIIVARPDPINKDDMVRNETDRSLQEKYPILFKKVFTVLAHHEKPTSVDSLQSEIGMYFRMTDIFTILMQASWSKECSGGSYQYIKEAVVHVESTVKKLQVNFSEIGAMPFTKPTKVLYFEENLGSVASWAEAYVKLVAALYDDYPSRIPINQSFNGTGRPDFGDEKTSERMKAPKHVVENFYLETNISATDILRKIKTVLDICNVDYDNVVIEYERKSQNDVSTEIRPVNIKSESSFALAPNEEAFYIYLSQVAKKAEATCRGYVSAIRNVERFAKEHHYSLTKVYGQSLESVRELVDELFQDKDFIEYNAQQHNRFRAAINQILESMNSRKVEVEHPTSQPVEPIYEDTSDYEKVLEERFVKGFRLGSALEMKKFKRYYAELNGREISQDDAEIERIIRSCGIVHEEKLFMPKTMLSDDLKKKLLDYILDSFASGKTSIYYEALFSEFSEDFLDHYIYNAEMLKAYLMYLGDGSYHIGKNQVTKEAGITSDPIDEVRSCLKDYGRPMETDMLCEILSHLPRNNVIAILGSNLEFVRNSKGEYFHADVMALTEEELDNIENIIDEAIHSNNFISGTELLKAIKAKYPYTYEAYSSFSDIAWRDALKYKLGERFSFKGNIISAPNATLSMMDVFGNLAANAEQLSMDELLSFSKEMGTVIYFDPVYDNAIRVSEELFVSKSHASFQIKETDAILDRFVKGSYIPLKEVNVFGIFPDAGFTWNIYLLESYVASYSEKYTLIHGGYNRNCAVGAIVKRSAGYQNLDSLVVDVLADSGISLNKTDALEYLSKNGYISRRTYSGIEGLLIQANAKRQTGRRI